MIPRFTTYQAICEHLEVSERITDATECFREMESELGEQTDSKRTTWSTGE